MLDPLIEQVHGSHPPPLLRDVELVRATVGDAGAVAQSLEGVDAVIHLAAEVGVGQSMYEIGRYVGTNDLGTAVLLEQIIRRPVRRVVVASSMSVYGEGLYRDVRGKLYQSASRPAGGPQWDPLDADGNPLLPLPTPETKPVALSSVYALTKYAQERLTLMVTAAYGIEASALRLFNVFGPGQALSNPYTGVLAIFAARLSNAERPLVFEDGRQKRDFVHVADVAEAFMLALDRPEAAGRVFNIGSGQPIDVIGVARALARAMGMPDIEPQVIGKARTGDVRHCFADIGLAQQQLGYVPSRRLDDTTLGELAEWVSRQQAVDRVGHAYRELEARGLVS